MRGPLVRLMDYADRKDGIEGDGMEASILKTPPEERRVMRAMFALHAFMATAFAAFCVEQVTDHGSVRVTSEVSPQAAHMIETGINTGLKLPAILGGVMMVGFGIESAVNFFSVGKDYVPPAETDSLQDVE